MLLCLELHFPQVFKHFTFLKNLAQLQFETDHLEKPQHLAQYKANILVVYRVLWLTIVSCKKYFYLLNFVMRQQSSVSASVSGCIRDPNTDGENVQGSLLK